MNYEESPIRPIRPSEIVRAVLELQGHAGDESLTEDQIRQAVSTLDGWHTKAMYLQAWRRGEAVLVWDAEFGASLNTNKLGWKVAEIKSDADEAIEELRNPTTEVEK